MRYWILVLSALIGTASLANARTTVVASVPPLATVVEAIGGDAVEVWSFLPNGANCHSYQPRPRDLAQLEQAELFFACGVDYELRAAPRLRDQFPTLAWVDLREGLPLRRVGEGANALWDPHWWLDLGALRLASARIERELSTRQPALAAQFAANREALLAELDALEAELSAQLDGVSSDAFLVYHGAWGYPAERFGLRQLVLAPSAAGATPRRVQALLADLNVDRPGVVLVQPQEPNAPAAVMAEALETPLVSCDPLKPDFAAALRCWAAAVAQSAHGE